MRVLILSGALLFAAVAFAQAQKPSGAAAQSAAAGDVAPFISVSAPVFVLTHVRVIDGTGAAAAEDQAVVVAGGKIKAMGPAVRCRFP